MPRSLSQSGFDEVKRHRTQPEAASETKFIACGEAEKILPAKTHSPTLVQLLIHPVNRPGQTRQDGESFDVSSRGGIGSCGNDEIRRSGLDTPILPCQPDEDLSKLWSSEFNQKPGHRHGKIS
jgi:hypothetical protein